MTLGRVASNERVIDISKGRWGRDRPCWQITNAGRQQNCDKQQVLSWCAVNGVRECVIYRRSNDNGAVRVYGTSKAMSGDPTTACLNVLLAAPHGCIPQLPGVGAALLPHHHKNYFLNIIPNKNKHAAQHPASTTPAPPQRRISYRPTTHRTASFSVSTIYIHLLSCFSTHIIFIHYKRVATLLRSPQYCTGARNTVSSLLITRNDFHVTDDDLLVVRVITASTNSIL